VTREGRTPSIENPAREVRLPPIEPVREIVGRLEAAGIACALGGSGLLAALGLWDRVRDWDLTTDAPVDHLTALLEGGSFERFGPSGVHADSKLVIAAAGVDLIAEFALRAGDAVCRLPTIVTRRWNGLPLGSPEVWAVAYTLLERPAKAERLFDHLARAGADEAARALLDREPLPDDLRRRLAEVPRREE